MLDVGPRKIFPSLSSSSKIISLNFIAGNPVNFQFIINPESHPGAAASQDYSTDRQFVDAITRVTNPLNWPALMSSMQEYCGAEFAAAYNAKKSGLDLLPELGNQPNGPVPAPAQIHDRVARTGEDYVFVTITCVQQAV